MSGRGMPGGMKDHERLREEIDAVLGAPRSRPQDVELPRGAGGDRLLSAVAQGCDLETPEADRTCRVVLAALSDRITPDEARHLSAQLAEPWKTVVRKRPAEGVQKMDREQFVGRVCRDLGVDVAESIKRCRAVFAALESQVQGGETRQVLDQLPRDLRPVMKPPSD